MKRIALLLLSTITIVACKSKTDETQTADSTAAIAVDTVATATKRVSAEETLCFELKEGKDVTTVKLVMKGDSITGEMEWLPWEKDGAVGTLKGKKVGGEIIADYNYMIEGNNQSEEKIFKLDGDKLLIKEGELTETKTGKLVLKNASKAKYSETLLKVNCK